MTTQRDMPEHQVAAPRDRRLTALAELAGAALAGTDLATLRQQTVDCVVRALGVDSSTIWEPTPDGRAVLLRAGSAPGGSEPATIELVAGSALHGLVHGKLALLDNGQRADGQLQQPELQDGHPVACSLIVSIAEAGRPRSLLSAETAGPHRFDENDYAVLQALADTLALGTERLAAAWSFEQRVRQRTVDIERRRQVAQSLHEILAILNSSHTLDGLLAYIIAQACRLLGAAAGAIHRLQSAGGVLMVQASWGFNSAEPALDLPLERGAAGEAVRTRLPVRFEPAQAGGRDSRRDAHSDGATRLHAVLAVPLIIKGEVYGTITLFDKRARVLSDDDVGLASTLGDHAALAIENARLVASAQDKAVLEERQRLARDLHDSVTQALYGVTLHAQAARRLLESANVTTAADSLRALQDTAQEALDEMRLLIFELRPPILDRAGLVAALQARLEAVEGRVNLKTNLLAEQLGVLPPAVEHALYRIAQEALNNALKHAHARCISVELRRTQTSIILEISDDGIGFDPAGESGGFGLRGIRERVSYFDGRLEIQSAPRSGTMLCVEIAL